MEQPSSRASAAAAVEVEASSSVLVEGASSECVFGEVLFSDVGLSFWGGVDPETGRVIDARHPLFGECVSGRVLCLPSGRGSCTGSQVVLELVLNGVGPAAILLRETDDIIALGCVVAEEVMGRAPFRIAAVGAAFERLEALGGEVVRVGADGRVASRDGEVSYVSPKAAKSDFAYSEADARTLAGARGPAAAAAMRIVGRVAAMQGATSLVDVTKAHIDACTYIGPGGLEFAEKLVDLGGRFQIPTTTNACSVDRKRWRDLGVPAALGEPATRLADAYVALGAAPSFTCAPYLRRDAPERGDHLGYSESNAVVFVNSVTGARSQKYADYMDACVALAGRAPLAGAHLDERRRAGLVLDVSSVVGAEAHGVSEDADGFFAALGYVVGLKAGTKVPLVVGLEGAETVASDDLKGFSAAFGTTAAAPLFHIADQTPGEGLQADLSGVPVTRVTLDDVRRAWADLGGAVDGSEDAAADLVALGSPHASAAEVARLARLVRACGARKHPETRVVVTLSQAVLDDVPGDDVAALRAWGVTFVTDTCWCMLDAPVVPNGGDEAARVVTNSAKYSHYAPGLVDRRPHLAGLVACVTAAATGCVPSRAPSWLARGPTLLQRRTLATLRLARRLF